MPAEIRERYLEVVGYRLVEIQVRQIEAPIVPVSQSCPGAA